MTELSKKEFFKLTKEERFSYLAKKAGLTEAELKAVLEETAKKMERVAKKMLKK